MTLSVAARGRAVATFRFVEVFLMETLARWVPTTPEMEVKVVFGQHIWDVAQHADAFGRRTHELRGAINASLRPAEPYAALLGELARVEATVDRLDALYEAVLPGLARRFRHYAERTDALMDAPTVRILERALGDFARMSREAREVRDALPGLSGGDAGLLARLQGDESAIGEIVAPEAAVEAAK